MNELLLQELLAMQRRDFDTRSRLQKAGQLYGGYADEMQQVHRENAETLDRIVSKHGWPGVAAVGIEGCRAAWLVAQHSICTPGLQRKFHDLLSEAVRKADAPQQQLAFLTDRIRFNEMKPQVYGTVLDWNERGELACDIEDPSGLDARRQTVGLRPFKNDLERHRSEIRAEGGGRPPDFDEYRRRRAQWARSVGWI
ncbi:MAG TPA: DUF6624 domain-containing protein [Burkholderiales bacterium]|nr:DUF6624 domain-containing protein [Burkholderiales bacterium]